MPQDRAVEERRPDQPYEADVSHDTPRADLQARAERLPVGHPSSPHHDDGSLRPTALDLSQYELPLPDEPGEPELDTEDRARYNPDGSWDWRGRHLTPEQSRTADEALARCRDAEGRDAGGNYGDHGLTPAMRRIEAQLDHGHLVEDTEKFALKDPDRFKEKLADSIRGEPDKLAEEHATEIHDGVRYTFIFDRETYVSSLEQASEELKGLGFELGVLRNTWGDDEYKGINTRWQDYQSTCRFEVQFHTEESWQVKQTMHWAYERINDVTTPADERERLRAYQRDVSSQLALPDGWESITNYRREGW